MAKQQKKSTKPRSKKYEEKLKTNLSFEEIIKLTITTKVPKK